VNADTLAAHLAGRLKSPRLIIAGATAGVLDADGTSISELTFREMEALVASGGVTAGMIAKLAACRRALESGAAEVFIADGKDLTGLAVLARNGRDQGAATSTRIRAVERGNARQANSRQIRRNIAS
jgi:acetylglutamate kinase